MKHIFALGTVFITSAWLASACVASDADDEPDTTENTGGSAGSGGDGGNGGTATGGSGGTTVTGDAAVNTSSTSGGSGGSGGTYSSGGTDSGGTAGAGGWAGDDGDTDTTTTTTSSTTSTTGGGGNTTECLGDDDVDVLPDCEHLSYAAVVCDEFDPPEPFGVTHCKQFQEHATPEAFEALFDCLDDIDEEDACSEAHDDAVRVCRDGTEDEHDEFDGVFALTCPSELAREKCANMACPEIDREPDGTCDVFLSAFTPSGVDHVIACTNEFTADESGGSWGAGPDTTGCGVVFQDCVIGLLQPH